MPSALLPDLLPSPEAAQHFMRSLGENPVEQLAHLERQAIFWATTQLLDLPGVRGVSVELMGEGMHDEPLVPQISLCMEDEQWVDAPESAEQAYLFSLLDRPLYFGQENLCLDSERAQAFMQHFLGQEITKANMMEVAGRALSPYTQAAMQAHRIEENLPQAPATTPRPRM